MAKFKLPDYDKLDDMDIYIQSGPPNPELDKAFSEFLKAHKAKEAAKQARSKNAKHIPASPKRSKVRAK